MKSKYILIIALLMAIVTTVLFRQYVINIDKKYKVTNQIVAVVVPAKEIAANTKVTKDMLTIKEVSAGSILKDAIKTDNDIEGKYATTDLKAGEVLYNTRFTDQFTESEDITKKIADGARALSIGVSDVTAVAKMIQPEDYVDVVNTINGQTYIVVENVRVLAVGKSLTDLDTEKTDENAQEKTDYGTITLELYPGDAIKVINADETGSVKFVLRGQLAP
jgi:pilus assembly protein CpaB